MPRFKPMAIVLVLLAVAAGLPSFGCGDSDDDGDTSPATATSASTVTGEEDAATAGAINAYVEQVRELVHIGDQLNVDYHDLTNRYNNREVPAEEVIAAAEQNTLAYSDMISQLDRTTVPEGLEEAHDMIVSGFEMWEQMYQLDARGLAERNNELLDQARALDNEAVAAVNEAIAEINRLKE